VRACVRTGGREREPQGIAALMTSKIIHTHTDTHRDTHRDRDKSSNTQTHTIIVIIEIKIKITPGHHGAY